MPCTIWKINTTTTTTNSNNNYNNMMYTLKTSKMQRGSPFQTLVGVCRTPQNTSTCCMYYFVVIWPYLTCSSIATCTSSSNSIRPLPVSLFAGWVFDATENYDASFWLMGAMIALSGIMLYPIPLIQKYQLKKPAMLYNQAHDMNMGKRVGSSSYLLNRVFE